MRNSKNFFLGVFVGIVASVAIVIGLFDIAMSDVNVMRFVYKVGRQLDKSLQSGNYYIPSEEGMDWDAVEDKSRAIYDVIDKYYLNEIDNEKMKDYVYKGIVNSLGDRYSEYFTEEEYERFNSSSSGTYQGIGVLVQKNEDTGEVVVVKTFEKGSSYEEGVQAGDVIYKIENEEVTELELSEVVAKIKGEEGTFVHVTVLRNGKEIEFDLERRRLEVDTVKHKMIEKNGKKIGYIAVAEFDEVTDNQFKEAIKELEKEGMQGLVIDLRDNPGGLLDVACSMLDRMIKKGILVYTLDKDGNKTVEEAEDNESFDKPVSIIVNGGSASASEVFAGAMQDYKAATLVGTTTFGKGIVQSILSMGDGTAVKVTVSKYYTPNGRNIHGTGITPDVEAALDEKAIKDGKLDEKKDNQLNKAIKVVEEKIGK